MELFHRIHNGLFLNNANYVNYENNPQFVHCLQALTDTTLLKNVYLHYTQIICATTGTSTCTVPSQTCTPSHSNETDVKSHSCQSKRNTCSEDFKQIQNVITHSIFASLQQSIICRLVVSENDHPCNTEKKLFESLDPNGSFMPQASSNSGKFFMAIVVGPWVLQFTDFSICVPHLINPSELIFYAHEEGYKVNDISLEELCNIIAEIVVKWNTELPPCDSEKVPEKCVEFVLYVLERLNVKQRPSSLFCT